MVNVVEIRKRRKVMARRRAIVKKIKYTAIAGVLVAAFIMAAKAGLLDDTPIEYKIPEGAISGGVIEIKGKAYERFQLDGKFYLLDLSNGAEIPQ